MPGKILKGIRSRILGTNTSPPSNHRDLIAKSDGWYDIDSGGVATKLGGIDWNGSSTSSLWQKRVDNIVRWNGSIAAPLGVVVLDTDLPNTRSTMILLHVQGQVHSGTDAIIDVWIRVYWAAGAITTTQVLNNGTWPLDTVETYLKTATNTLSFGLTTTNPDWDWGKIWVDGYFAYSTMVPDAELTGWTSTLLADPLVSGYTALTTLTPVASVITNETQTLTNKTLALGLNAVSGTMAQFNTAVTDGDISYTTHTHDAVYIGPSDNFKKAVRTMPAGSNVTLSGLQTISGVALSAGDRVLVWQQTVGANNGIYIVSAGAWTRATDCDTADKMAGAVVTIDDGDYVGYTMVNKFKATDTLGTTDNPWWFVLSSRHVGSTVPAMTNNMISPIHTDEYAVTSTPGTTVTLDMNTARVFALNPNQNVTTLNITNVPASRSVTVTLAVFQGATAYSIAAPTGARWIGGSNPTQVANKICVYTFETLDGGTNWMCTASREV